MRQHGRVTQLHSQGVALLLALAIHTHVEDWRLEHIKLMIVQNSPDSLQAEEDKKIDDR